MRKLYFAAALVAAAPLPVPGAASVTSSQENPVECAGALRARIGLSGLTPEQQSNYTHDAMSFGAQQAMSIPKNKLTSWMHAVAVSERRWASIARTSEGRVAIELQSDVCRGAHEVDVYSCRITSDPGFGGGEKRFMVMAYPNDETVIQVAPWGGFTTYKNGLKGSSEWSSFASIRASEVVYGVRWDTRPERVARSTLAVPTGEWRQAGDNAMERRAQCEAQVAPTPFGVRRPDRLAPKPPR